MFPTLLLGTTHHHQTGEVMPYGYCIVFNLDKKVKRFNKKFMITIIWGLSLVLVLFLGLRKKDGTYKAIYKGDFIDVNDALSKKEIKITRKI